MDTCSSCGFPESKQSLSFKATSGPFLFIRLASIGAYFISCVFMLALPYTLTAFGEQPNLQFSVKSGPLISNGFSLSNGLNSFLRKDPITDMSYSYASPRMPFTPSFIAPRMSPFRVPKAFYERLRSAAVNHLATPRSSSSLSSATLPPCPPAVVSTDTGARNPNFLKTISASAGHPSSSVLSRPSTLPSTVTHREDLARARDNVCQGVAQMLYEDMLMGRMMEDMCAQMYYRGKVPGFVHLYNGQEAVSTGIVKALRPDDYCVSTYRDHVHAISKGVPPREVFAELYGKETGCSKGRGGSMHMFSKKYGMVGGFAYIGEQAINDQASDQVTVCFTGDGSTNMGQFYEAMNMAAFAKLPVVFVVENNNWAIGMAHYRSTSVPEIYEKAEGFGIPGVEVDGMDVLAVRKVAREAVDRSRGSDGPTLIEALTYRFRLRAPVEEEAWLDRDPIASFADYMQHMGYATLDSLKQTQKKLREIVDDVVRFADGSPEPAVEDNGKYIFGSHYTLVTENLGATQLREYARAVKAEVEFKELRKAGDKTPGFPVHLDQTPLTVID